MLETGSADEAIVNYRKSIECKPDFVEAAQLAIELNRKKSMTRRSLSINVL